MGKRDHLQLGDWNAICDVCGFKFKASEMQQRWDKLMVCADDFEFRHPQDFIRAVPDDQAVPWVRSDRDLGSTGQPVNDVQPTYNNAASALGLPTLGYNFLGASLTPQYGTQALTFTRSGSNATRVNASGLVEVMASDSPRFDFDPLTLQCKGLLFETSRTNLTIRSAEFDNASWVKSETTINPNIVTSPAGTFTADGIVASSNFAQHRTLQTGMTVSAGARVTLSIWAKAGSESVLDLFVSNAAQSRFVGRSFNLLTGAVTTTAFGDNGYTFQTASTTQYPDGWWRCDLSVTTITDTTIEFHFFPRTASAWTGDGGSNAIYLWGAQTEVGNFSTTYIPTTTVLQTRSADISVITSLGSWFSATTSSFLIELSLFTKSTQNNGAAQIAVSFNDNTDPNRYGFYAGKGGTDLFSQFDLSGGSLQTDTTAGTATTGVVHRGACAFKLNDCAVSLNGATVGIDTDAIIPAVTQLNLGGDHSVATREVFGHLRRFYYFPSRLTNERLQVMAATGIVDYWTPTWT